MNEIPAYLNKEFFAKCLKKDLNITTEQIESLDIAIGTNPGDNYTSFMYRVKVNYRNVSGEIKTLHLMVKSMPTDGDRAFLEEVNFHEKESRVYMELLPQIHEMLGSSRIAPKCYYSTREPIQTIVFENLKSQGYSLADRVIGLDENQCRLVLDKLAKLHATGMSILEKTPQLQENFKRGFFCEESVHTFTFQIFFRQNLKKAATMVLEMPGFESFAPKLIAIYDNFPALALKAVEFNPKEIKTFVHGDVWVNNIMFKYHDSGIPNDALLVDFQSSYVNSPALDLNYFFASSVKLDILKRKAEFIEKYYYPVFKDTLNLIGHESIPDLEQVFSEVQSRELFSLFHMIGSFPLISLNWEESKTNSYAQFHDETIASKKRNIGMSSERFINTMQYGLKYFEKLNIFQRALESIK